MFNAENQQQVCKAAYEENIQTALNELENNAAYLHLEAGLIDRYLGNLDSAFLPLQKSNTNFTEMVCSMALFEHILLLERTD
ncbi:MAG: hypothetical protein IPN26_17635 [Bacteroidetes bacterium]|nr:hypothetical protein [Bacteroidota bacterium]